VNGQLGTVIPLLHVAAKSKCKFVNCFFTMGSITCLCTGALTTLATPLSHTAFLYFSPRANL